MIGSVLERLAPPAPGETSTVYSRDLGHLAVDW